MTDKAEVVVTPEPTPDAAGFDIGFNKTAGQPADASVKPEVKPVVVEEVPKEAPVTEVVADPWDGVPVVVRQALETLPTRLRNIEGHIGGLTSSMKAAKEAAAAATKAGAEAPTQAQVQAATTSGEKWKQIKEDFPEWADAMEERLAAQAATSRPAPVVDVDALKREWSESTKAQVAGAVDQAEERAFVRLKHPGWKATVNTESFRSWMTAQPPELRALANSDLADDAIKMLDAYATVQKAAAKKAADDAEKKKRLEGAVTPKGTGSPAGTTTTNDEDAFAGGFKKVTKRA